MDRCSDRSLWSKIKGRFFSHSDSLDNLEQAIIEARDDGELEAAEGSMILSILQMEDIQVQDIMTPRTDFDCVPSGTPLIEVAAFCVESGHSRLPVYQETRDNIIGIAYAKDMLQPLLEPDQKHIPIDALMRNPFFVPETKFVGELLQEFRTRKNHLAIVVDEYGGTSGLVTIEDVLEEIVGDIEDEHDTPREEDIREVQPAVFSLSGRALLEDLQVHGMQLAAEEVDTIGGFLCLEAGHVPCKGEQFAVDGWLFTVDDADLKQILRVTAKRTEAETASAEEGQKIDAAPTQHRHTR